MAIKSNHYQLSSSNVRSNHLSTPLPGLNHPRWIGCMQMSTILTSAVSDWLYANEFVLGSGAAGFSKSVVSLLSQGFYHASIVHNTWSRDIPTLRIW